MPIALVPAEPRERRKLATLSVGIFLILFGAWLGQNLALSTVLQRRGASGLPLMFLLNALGMAASAYPTVLLVQRFTLRRVLPLFFVAGLSAVLIVRWAAWREAPWTPGAMYVAAYVITDLGVALFWSLANQAYDARQAKRVFPLISAVGTLGGALSGFFARGAVRFVSGEGLLDVWAGVLVLGAIWATRAIRLLPPVAPTRRRTVPERHAGLSGPDRGLFLAIGTGLAGVVLLALVGRYEYGHNLNLLYGNDLRQIAAINGLLIGWGSLATLVLQIFVTPRLIYRTGVGGTGVVYPLAMLVGLVVAVVDPGLLAAVLLFFGTTNVRQGVQGVLEPVLYTPLPADAAAQAVVFMSGVAFPSGMALAGVLLLGLSGMPGWIVPAAGIAGAIALLVVAGWRAAAYRASLRARLARGGKELRLRFAASVAEPDATAAAELARALDPEDPQVLDRLRTLIRLDARRARASGSRPATEWDPEDPFGRIVDARARESYLLLGARQALEGELEEAGARELLFGAIRHRLGENVSVILAALRAGTRHVDYERISLNLLDAPARVRAAAVDILETICPSTVRPVIVPLVEEAALAVGRRAAVRRYGDLSVSDPVGTLLGINDPWLRACTVYAMAHLGREEYAEMVRPLRTTDDPFLAFSCEYAMTRLTSAG